VSVRAIRAATTIDVDTQDELNDRVAHLLAALMEANELVEDDLISILFTATDDIRSGFPATAARRQGFTDVPLICARELAIEGATPMCVRLMIHVETDRSRSEISHVYQRGAKGLREDLTR